MIELPKTTIRPWVQFQVYYKNGGKWIKLQTMQAPPGSVADGAFPFSDISPSQRGIYVASVSKIALPSFGTATLQTPIGNINTVNYNFKDNDITAPDLKGKQIYIEATVGSEATRTIFWGVVDYQRDHISPSANDFIIGHREYKASDLLYWVASRATMDSHGYAYDELEINRAPGMPWYNGRLGRTDLAQGNKAIHLAGGLPVPILNLTEPIERDAGGTAFELRRFTFDGLGGLWSDKEVVLHALHTGQINWQLIEFKLDDIAGLLNTQDNTWPVRENQRAWSFIKQILRFQRGAGISYFDFETNGDGSPKNPTIRVRPVHDVDITVTLPEDGSQEVIQGAITSGTDITVDITGDHRNVDGFFSLGGVEDFKYDRIEVVGEKIQVLCQLGDIDSNLIKLWTTDEETNFDSLTKEEASHNRYDHIYRLFGVPRDWNGVTGDGNGGVGEVNGIYFYCDDDGVIAQATNISYLEGFINPALLRILPDIPLHNGINPLTGLRYAGLGDAIGVSMRGRMLFHIRNGSDDFSIMSPQQRLKSDGIWIGGRNDDARDRSIGIVDMKTDNDKVVVTCCVELPYRVSVSRGLAHDAADKTKRIRLSGAELWIGAQGTMYAIPAVDAPLRFVTRQLLRDDRNRLAHIAYLAEYWYIKPHRAAKWALRDFGIGGSFKAAIKSTTPESAAQILDDNNQPIETALESNLTTIDYPQIGELVTTLNVAGTEQIINAPISMVRYDNRQGATYYQCDWGELEL